MKKSLFIILMGFIFKTNAELFKTPIIETQYGMIQGFQQNDVNVFKGIPYASDPFTTENRFKEPQPVSSWKGVRSCIDDSPVIQPGRTTPTSLVGETGDLTLNIWSPVKIKGALPVMVWIPGGAWIREDADEAVYDGSRFAQKGVILVTVNYRVGVDGFMHFDNYPDNRGLLDQIAAMKWVKENISNFGGDPNNITLFGQSAGAGSVAIHLGNPETYDLFQKAILQSPPVQTLSIKDAERIRDVFAHNLAISPDPDSISKVPFDVLVNNILTIGQQLKDYDKWGKIALRGTVFLPVIDGKIIKKDPLENIKNNHPQKPIIVGSTDYESRLYLVPDNSINRIKKEDVVKTIKEMGLPESAYGIYKKYNVHKSDGDLYVALLSDYTFRMPAFDIAQMSKNVAPTWYYNFSWSSPAYDNKLGAAHFVDVPFVFDTIRTKEAQFFVGNQPPENLAQEMNDAWVSFAKTGEPGWEKCSQSHCDIKTFSVDNAKYRTQEKEIEQLWHGFSF